MSGVVGIYGPQGSHVAQDLYYALYALQHRGQLTCGMAVNQGGKIETLKGMGLIHDVVGDKDIPHLLGNFGIGHIKSSTSFEAPNKYNVEPMTVRYKHGSISCCSDGEIVNYKQLRAQLENKGALFQTELNAELVAFLIARYQKNGFKQALLKTIEKLQGSYCLVGMSQEALWVARDSHGIKPLTLGTYEDHWIVASESCAIETIGGQVVRDVLPGEIIYIDKDGLQTLSHQPNQRALCLFELVYLSRPDSTIDDRSVYMTRVEIGKQLYREHPIADADIVIGAPDSGIIPAIGYAQASKIPYAEGLIKNRYIGRTFIEPTLVQRENEVRIKLNPLKENIKGKRVILVDDSIVRGTTMKRTVKMLYAAGAKAVHLAIASPPVSESCHLGLNTPYVDELYAHSRSIEAMKEDLGVDSLSFISIEGILKAAGGENGFCKGCFNGIYPVDKVEVDK